MIFSNFFSNAAVNAKQMRVKWQVMVDGNLDLCATDYKDKYSMGTCYNWGCYISRNVIFR